MALSNGILGARARSQVITWTDDSGNAINLTGATLSGKIKSKQTYTLRDIDGSLAIITAASGIFSWTYGANDVGESGEFWVQFKAAYAGQPDKTYLTEWEVKEAII